MTDSSGLHTDLVEGSLSVSLRARTEEGSMTDLGELGGNKVRNMALEHEAREKVYTSTVMLYFSTSQARDLEKKLT